VYATDARDKLISFRIIMRIVIVSLLIVLTALIYNEYDIIESYLRNEPITVREADEAIRDAINKCITTSEINESPIRDELIKSMLNDEITFLNQKKRKRDGEIIKIGNCVINMKKMVFCFSFSLADHTVFYEFHGTIVKEVDKRAVARIDDYSIAHGAPPKSPPK